MKSFHTEANHMQTTNSGPTLQARDSLKHMKPKDLSNDMYSYIINANKNLKKNHNFFRKQRYLPAFVAITHSPAMNSTAQQHHHQSFPKIE